MTTTDFNPDPTVVLQQLGFTEYEARVYVTLVAQGAMNGYQLAKHSGIPRANVYAVADKLLERGAVSRVQQGRGQSYQAVPPPTLLRSLRAGQERAFKAADQALASLAQVVQPTSVFNLRGDELLARARQLIETSRTHLCLAIQQPEAAALADVLRDASARGVTITTLCLEACEGVCAGCQGQVHRFALAPCDGSRWLILTSDGAQALLGQFNDAMTEGLATGQHLVVELTEAYIRQSIALATLGSELAGRFNGLLSEQARQLLEACRVGAAIDAD